MDAKPTLDLERIRFLEAIAVTAWPPAAAEPLEGWRLGFDRGVTRRANSVMPNDLPAGADPEALIDEVERRYRAHGLAPCFKICPAAQPADLDQRLAARGYRAEGHARVLAAPPGPQSRPSGSEGLEIRLQEAPDAAWLTACWPGADPADAEAKRLISMRIRPPRCFALALVGGQPAGAAAAAVEAGWTCINAVQTHPDFRRRGIARALMAALTAWAGDQGAEQLYLQVEEDNEPAQRLYAGLGFAFAYPYHYRRLAAG